MPQVKNIDDNHFLNRLPLQQMADISSIDPYARLTQSFDYANPREWKKALLKFCQAALAEDYDWKKGIPGDCLYFAEELEALLEVCYIIHQRTKKERSAFEDHNDKGTKPKSADLSIDDVTNPQDFLGKFFTRQSLPEWKLALHNWLEAALSNHSVVTMINPSEILPFKHWIGRLVETAYQICEEKRPKRK